MIKRLIALGVILAAFPLGLTIRPSGIYDPTPTHRRENVSPPVPEPLMSGVRASSYTERLSSCRNPGNAAGYCWFEGWAFARKTICIDSSIPGAPLARIASDFTGIAGLRIVNGGTRAGNCAAKGYPASQRISFLSMSKTGAARYGYRVCGLTAPANYGNLTSVNVTIYVTGAERTPCGGAPEWTDVFEHEFGHTLGLSHNQPYATSIMRDGHRPDASDRAKLGTIYSKRRA